MTVRPPSIGALLLFVAAASAPAQTRDELRLRCLADEPDTSIAGCTALIASGQETGKNAATAYFNRGLAYKQKREYRGAIEDFTRALVLDPDLTDALRERVDATRALALEGPAQISAVVLDTPDSAIPLASATLVPPHDIARVRAMPDEFGRGVVDIWLTAAGATKMRTLTSTHEGRYLALFVGGQSVVNGVIRGAISARAEIIADSLEAARSIAATLDPRSSQGTSTQGP